MNASTIYDFWIWMREKTSPDWAATPATEKAANRTKPNAPITNTIGGNNKFHNTLYRLQHKDRQTKGVINETLHFGISCVPNRASVPLNKGMNSEPFEHCTARLPIQSWVLQCCYEQILSTEHEFQSPNNACTELFTWTHEMKITKSTRAFKHICNGKKTNSKNKNRKNYFD